MTIFGGKTTTETSLGDVWTLRNANGLGGAPTWVKLAPTGPIPSPRHMATAEYDGASDRMIVFGGHAEPGPFVDELWVLEHATGLGGTPRWNPLTPAGPRPAAREWHTSVYDRATNQMVVFGGLDLTGKARNDVWVLKHANALTAPPTWSERKASGTAPSPRVGHCAVYDATSDRMIIFGGSETNGWNSFVNDTWILDHALHGGPAAWTKLTVSGAPSAREDHRSAYDPGTNRMIIFGGWTDKEYFAEVWILEHANGLGGWPTWVQLNPSGKVPAARELHSCVYDAVTNRLIVFAGATNTGKVSDIAVLVGANGL